MLYYALLGFIFVNLENVKNIKNSVWRNSVLIPKHHAMAVVILNFNPSHTTYVTLHQAVVTRYGIIVTCRMSHHASGHLMMYREGCSYERAFFTLRCFLPCTSNCFLKVSLTPAVQTQVSRSSY